MVIVYPMGSDTGTAIAAAAAGTQSINAKPQPSE
jgi:predicted NodU family carbamoyl transferase